MANVFITLKIMPDSPEADLKEIESKSIGLLKNFGAKGEPKTEIEPIAFGLKALKINFVLDEAKGSTEAVEKQIQELPQVSSAEVVFVTRAVG